ncbi:endospore germination permease [Paenibacillus sp. CGMCC 1.16610]|uniref:Endospore germination permease n=1 Tax=Paenibacillus anseongense TaxID=2682845 RepID=A0ABW9UJH2_9BACL|nr:endospore germination permease [Paenibacillus sp. CGMCC 1.16610]MBA2939767.1 endospore germination permease [Paenibacillus sp. CGMCC 1.16610]MVQ39427.1 endospore germination permease [Paenibacillus anseongense]
MKFEKISPFQLGFLCFAFMSGFSTLYLLEAKVIMHDVWIANVTAMLAVLLILKVFTYVQSQFPNLNFSDIIEALFGKWLGKFVLVFYLMGMIGLGVLSLRSISLFYNTAILPNTSPMLIMGLVLCVTTYAAFLGLGTISRSIVLILPFFIVAILIIGFLIYQDVEDNPLLPQFQHPFPLILYCAMISFGFPFGKAGVIAFVFSEVTVHKKLYKSCSIAIVSSCIYLLMSTYLSFGSLGDNMFKTASFPFFSSIQMVKLGEYIERIEIMIISIWTVLTLFEIIVVQYVFVKIIGRMFKLRDIKALYLPVGAIFLVVSSKSAVNSAELIAYDLSILPFSIILPSILIPLSMLCLVYFRKIRR